MLTQGSELLGQCGHGPVRVEAAGVSDCSHHIILKVTAKLHFVVWQVGRAMRRRAHREVTC